MGDVDVCGREEAADAVDKLEGVGLGPKVDVE